MKNIKKFYKAFVAMPDNAVIYAGTYFGSYHEVYEEVAGEIYDSDVQLRAGKLVLVSSDGMED